MICFAHLALSVQSFIFFPILDQFDRGERSYARDREPLPLHPDQQERPGPLL